MAVEAHMSADWTRVKACKKKGDQQTGRQTEEVKRVELGLDFKV